MIKRYLSAVFAFVFFAHSPQALVSDLGPELTARAAVLFDSATGLVLFAKNPNERIPPASLTKLVTIYVALKDAMRLGIPLDAPMKVPPTAFGRNQPPRSSLMRLDEGHKVTLRELILGLSIPSGNDAAIAVALNFSPDIGDFAFKMNQTVKSFGLNNTFFVEPSGISEENYTTAFEFAEFCIEYIKTFPKNLEYFHSVPVFEYPKPENLTAERKNNPRTIIHNNHIGLIRSYFGVDGLKTGYIDESGWNLALTAERSGTRFVAVILGVPAELGAYRGPRQRDADGAALLDWGFDNFKTIRVVYPELAKVKIWKGKKGKAAVKPRFYGEDGALTVDTGRGEGLYYETDIYKALSAPIERGDRLGTFSIYDKYGELASIPLAAAEDVAKANIFKRLFDSILMFFGGFLP